MFTSIDKRSGTGNGQLNVTAPQFTGREQRKEAYSVKPTNGVAQALNITQLGATPFVSFDDPLEGGKLKKSIGKDGGVIQITGDSNLSMFKMQSTSEVISGVTYKLAAGYTTEADQTGWNGTTNIALDTDFGATKQFGYTLTLNIPENNTESARTHVFTVTDSGSASSAQVIVTQEAGVKTYGEIKTYGGDNYDPAIPAKGGSATPNFTYEQAWGWNGNTRNGGIITGSYTNPGDATFSYIISKTKRNASINNQGVVTVDSRGTEVGGVDEVAIVSIIIKSHGKDCGFSTAVRQKANTVTYSTPVIENAVVKDIPASGGSVATFGTTDKVLTVTQKRTYTSEAEETDTYHNGDTGLTYSASITANSLGTTEKIRTEVGKLKLTVSLHDKEASSELSVYQEENKIESWDALSVSYPTGAITVSEEATSCTIKNSETPSEGAGNTEWNLSTSQKAHYTSNAEQLFYNQEFSAAVKTAVEGFSLAKDGSNYVVSVTANPSAISTRGTFAVSIVVTGSDEQEYTGVIQFIQQAAASVLTLSPNALVFIADGETKTVDVTSNDSWTVEDVS